MFRYVRFFAIAFVILVLLALAIIGVSYTSHKAHAEDYTKDMPHMHMSGHWYPSECCSMNDCYALDPLDVKVTPKGYFLPRTNEVVPYSQARKSPDGKYHKCTSDADPDEPLIHPENKPMCLFTPDQSS